jgi:Type II secretion system (T2SS), protein M subtype b
MRADIVKWGRFVLFVLANGLAVAGLCVLFSTPAIDLLQEQRVRIEQGSALLQQASSVIARASLIAAIEPAEIEQAAQRFVHGESGSLANADLLTRLRQAGEEKGVSFSSVTTLPPREWSGRQLAGARIEFTAPTPRAAELLSHIEDGPSFLFITRAKLSAARESEADDGTVAAMVDVYAVMRGQKQ